MKAPDSTIDVTVGENFLCLSVPISSLTLPWGSPFKIHIVVSCISGHLRQFQLLVSAWIAGISPHLLLENQKKKGLYPIVVCGFSLGKNFAPTSGHSKKTLLLLKTSQIEHHRFSYSAVRRRLAVFPNLNSLSFSKNNCGYSSDFLPKWKISSRKEERINLSVLNADY